MNALEKFADLIEKRDVWIKDAQGEAIKLVSPYKRAEIAAVHLNSAYTNDIPLTATLINIGISVFEECNYPDKVSKGDLIGAGFTVIRPALIDGLLKLQRQSQVKVGNAQLHRAGLFDMYQNITDEIPYKTPMKIYPAVHYTMGGVWVDYNLMTSIPGCFAIGEANFSDHGANRLGASALMQGLADGYFVLPYTIGDYLSEEISTGKISTDSEEFEKSEKKIEEQIDKLINNDGVNSVDYYHKKLGKIMWEKCGMSRNEIDLKKAIKEIQDLRKRFMENQEKLNLKKISGDELLQEVERLKSLASSMDMSLIKLTIDPRNTFPTTKDLFKKQLLIM